MIDSFLNSYGLFGIAIGLLTFLIIGLFHPIVIKAEYYVGVKSWWFFLVLGVACLTLAVFLESNFFSAIAGVTGFTSLWSILEIFEQRQRVAKGWFPQNPRRKRKVNIG